MNLQNVPLYQTIISSTFPLPLSSWSCSSTSWKMLIVVTCFMVESSPCCSSCAPGSSSSLILVASQPLQECDEAEQEGAGFLGIVPACIGLQTIPEILRIIQIPVNATLLFLSLLLLLLLWILFVAAMLDQWLRNHHGCRAQDS